MPAFGSNSVTCAFARRVLYEPDRGFRLSDRIVSAIDRFVGALTRFRYPQATGGVMNRWLFIYPFVGGTDWTHALNLADAPNAGYQGGGSANLPTGNFDLFSITWGGSSLPTHNQNGVTMVTGSSGNTNCDMADAGGNFMAWNRRTHGIYSRTNSAVAVRDVSAQFVEPRNGYTYWQGLHLRWTDGNYYGDLCAYTKSGVTTTPNRNIFAVADSLGMFADCQRGPSGSTPYHYCYKRGVYVGGENTSEAGMGYGTGPVTPLLLQGSGRNYAFFFSTRHPWTLEGWVNTDGTGGVLPGSNAEFNYFVQQLQVAFLRAV